MTLGCFEFLMLLAFVFTVAHLVRRRDLRWLREKGFLLLRRATRLPGTKLILAALLIGLLFALVLAGLAFSGAKHTPFNEALVGFLFWSAVLLFFWGLAKLIWSLFQEPRRTDCPAIGRLKAFLDERLSSEERVRLAAHLEVCPACQHRVEGMTAGQKSWPGMARKLSASPSAPEPALRKVMAKLKESNDEPTGDEPVFCGDLPLGFLSPTDKPGQLGRLERYEVLEEIGRGGMGVVLKAFDPSLHRVVAIKVLAPQLATSGVARQRFLREAKAAAAVTHDHIVTIHAVDEANGLPYLVMQYIAGMSLQERIDKDGPLELADILRIGMQTASGLAAAHGHGIVHRDIKPANILLEEGVQRVKITDFGLARAMDDASLTQSGFVAGSPLYMAPEQARGEALDHRADLFSLGSVLYTMCTGRPPFRAGNTLAVLRRVSEDGPRPIRETNPEIPDWLADVVAKLMAKEPAERFASAAEVEEVLGKHLAQLQHAAWVPPPRSPKPSSATTELPSSLTICLSCGANLQVPERMVGSIVHCFECGKPFHVEEGSEVLQVARPAAEPVGRRWRGRWRMRPRLRGCVWIAAGGVMLLLLLKLSFVTMSYYSAEERDHARHSKPPHPSAPTKAIDIPPPPAVPSWRNVLAWLPTEATLFGAIDLKPFGSLTLDDPSTQALLRLVAPEDKADRLTADNLGRIRIDGVSMAYYEGGKSEPPEALVHLQGLALDGRKRIVDFIRRDNTEKVRIEEMNLNSVKGQSARISGPRLPFALGIYDDQHLFLGRVLHKDSTDAQNVNVLERLGWFGTAKKPLTVTNILSGYNPPWVQAALADVPPDACGVLLGEIPNELRKVLSETLKLRVCPRTFVFQMRRTGQGVVCSLTLNLDKTGTDRMLCEDLEGWRLKGLDALQSRFPALKKDRQASIVLGQLLNGMKWKATGGSVQTQLHISRATFGTLFALFFRG